MSSRCITYHVNREDRIVYLSDEWQTFADENQASELTAESVLGKSLYDFISGKACKAYYEMLIERARSSYLTIQFPYRCDSPAKRRFMRMTISQLDKETTEFKSTVLKEEERDPVELFNSSAHRSKANEFLVVCSMCKKIHINSAEWLSVEQAVDRLKLFHKEKLPQLTHSLCYDCLEKSLEENRKSAEPGD